ncbi:MAG: stage III sporulation protein AD [Oscillospiraceae bacterium]|jgi:stage III sporulation protein AD|nr:stage III sporulation protein AD [Oscillospiraceae bacterium]MCI1991181.1 stage III sporulation protein AD [Oscillospiraceae bacterium]MCI2035274.1 stage III sporulation protein AD [Oscillospiraceae bacterium]
MNIVGIAGIAVIAAILAAMMRRYHQEYAVVISIMAGIVILFEIFLNISPAIRQISTLLSSAGLTADYALILFKTLGICFLAQFAADSCRDAGENALASQVELAGKIAIVILALPLFEKIAQTAAGLIGG